MPCLLDSSAPGVTKQMMVDWMHINHPQTAYDRSSPNIHCAIDFADPTSNTPALAASTNSKDVKHTIIIINQPVSSVATHYPILEPTIHEEHKPAIPSVVTAPAKRRASSQVRKSPKDTGHGSEARGGGSKSFKKRKVTNVSQSVRTPALNGEVSNKDYHPAAHGNYTRGSRNFIEEEDQDLKDLRDSLLFTWSSAPIKPDVTKGNEIPMQNNSGDVKHLTACHQPEDTKMAERVPDLIEFSDHECMDSENIVIGEDIPSLSAATACGKIKTGADVFVEERKREERLCQLEASQKDKLDRIEALTIDLFQTKLKVEEQDCRIQLLEKQNRDLEKKCEEMDSRSQEQVTNLQEQADGFRQQLATDRYDIVTQEGILEQLLANVAEEDEDEDESTGYQEPGQDPDDDDNE